MTVSNFIRHHGADAADQYAKLLILPDDAEALDRILADARRFDRRDDEPIDIDDFDALPDFDDLAQ